MVEQQFQKSHSTNAPPYQAKCATDKEKTTKTNVSNPMSKQILKNTPSQSRERPLSLQLPPAAIGYHIAKRNPAATITPATPPNAPLPTTHFAGASSAKPPTTTSHLITLSAKATLTVSHLVTLSEKTTPTPSHLITLSAETTPPSSHLLISAEKALTAILHLIILPEKILTEVSHLITLPEKILTAIPVLITLPAEATPPSSS